MRRTHTRTLSRRGVLWLGQTCNLACYFCYFRTKIDDKEHPEHPFMSLEKAKKICHTLRYVYGNTAVDIQGGEPTIYPHIFELIAYCREIGLAPTLITNAIVLAKKEMALRFREAGVNDFLVSIHALGEAYDTMVGFKHGSEKQMEALENLSALGISYRLNCTMTKEAVNQLEKIALLAIEKHCLVVNFIAFNPFADQKGRRQANDVPSYSALKEPLQKAIDLLEAHRIEVNVRYLPLCILEERYAKNGYNFQQLSYDHHEWDFNSWTWTTRFNQRSNSPELDEPIPILMYGIKRFNGLDFSVMSEHGTKAHYMKEIDIKEHLLRVQSADIPKTFLYKQNAKLRAQKHLEYRKTFTCKGCGVQDICDGFHNDYVAVFGEEEAKAFDLGLCVLDPTWFIKVQEKVEA